jgi:Arc/MetJ-type ribon-helix-helix transcriptional regulator
MLKEQTPESLVLAHLEALRAELRRDEQEMDIRERRYSEELEKLKAEITAGRAAVAKFEAWLAEHRKPE